MENSITIIEKLIEKATTLSKTSIELCKYKVVNKTVDIFSYIAFKMALFGIVVIALLFVNIGLAFWIGQELGKIYYGFFVIAIFYLIISILLFIFRDTCIKNPMSNFIINKMKEENWL